MLVFFVFFSFFFLFLFSWFLIVVLVVLVTAPAGGAPFFVRVLPVGLAAKALDVRTSVASRASNMAGRKRLFCFTLRSRVADGQSTCKFAAESKGP